MERNRLTICWYNFVVKTLLLSCSIGLCESIIPRLQGKTSYPCAQPRPRKFRIRKWFTCKWQWSTVTATWTRKRIRFVVYLWCMYEDAGRARKCMLPEKNVCNFFCHVQQHLFGQGSFRVAHQGQMCLKAVHVVEVWKTWPWKSQNFTFPCCDHDTTKLSSPRWSVYGVSSVIKTNNQRGGV